MFIVKEVKREILSFYKKKKYESVLKLIFLGKTEFEIIKNKVSLEIINLLKRNTIKINDFLLKYLIEKFDFIHQKFFTYNFS